MENSYGIGIANRYALFLDDESDPLETLSLKEQEKELKKKTKVAEKENKAKPLEQPKGKPVNVQKKIIKENTIKVQENKREGKLLTALTAISMRHMCVYWCICVNSLFFKIYNSTFYFRFETESSKG